MPRRRAGEREAGGQKVSNPMGAGKLRVLACAGTAALGVALLASACGSASSPSLLALAQTPGPASPTVTPESAPVLGSMSYGTFPASTDGLDALTLCEQWAVLRDQYVGRVRTETPYQLEQWFSSPAWLPAFKANSPLKTDPDYSDISTAFGLVSSGASASVANAEMLDAACAAAD
jgi:hypothetical protein